MISSLLGLVQAEFGPAESVLSTMAQGSHASNFPLDLSPVTLWEAREERELSPRSPDNHRTLVSFGISISSCVMQMCDPWMRSKEAPGVRVSVLVTMTAHSGAFP